MRSKCWLLCHLSEGGDEIKMLVILCIFQRVGIDNIFFILCIFQRMEIHTYWVTDIHMVYNHLPSDLYYLPYVYFSRCSTGQVPGKYQTSAA